jgi:hypothetical protein
VWLLALVVLALLASACGDSGKMKVYPVSGKVLYRGEPAAGAEVIFYKKSGDQAVATVQPAGRVQDDGSFRVTTFTDGDGAPAGEYGIGIVWRRPVDAKGNPVRKSGGLYPDFFGEFYASSVNPQFHTEVKPGTNELPTFELKDRPAPAASGFPKVMK